MEIIKPSTKKAENNDREAMRTNERSDKGKIFNCFKVYKYRKQTTANFIFLALS